MITTTGNIRTEEPKKPVPVASPNCEQTGDFRWYVDNRVPTNTTSTLQQGWIDSTGKIYWSDVPVVFANPTPLKDFKS